MFGNREEFIKELKRINQNVLYSNEEASGRYKKVKENIRRKEKIRFLWRTNKKFVEN